LRNQALVTTTLGRSSQARSFDGNVTLTITVRPEKFAISAASCARVGAREGVNNLPGEVLQPVHMGASVTYRVSVAGTELTVFQQNREAQRFQTSDKHNISWRACHSIALET
jgi:ABC-type Fe3+/spermidine/putrescine transport system ATPase subunit